MNASGLIMFLFFFGASISAIFWGTIGQYSFQGDVDIFLIIYNAVQKYFFELMSLDQNNFILGCKFLIKLCSCDDYP